MGLAHQLVPRIPDHILWIANQVFQNPAERRSDNMHLQSQTQTKTLPSSRSSGSGSSVSIKSPDRSGGSPYLRVPAYQFETYISQLVNLTCVPGPDPAFLHAPVILGVDWSDVNCTLQHAGYTQRLLKTPLKTPLAEKQQNIWTCMVFGFSCLNC